MIYPIVKYPEKVLEKKTERVTKFDAELEKLVEDMFESMYAAKGIGLAAPQIGISKRLTIIDLSFKENPSNTGDINHKLISSCSTCSRLTFCCCSFGRGRVIRAGSSADLRALPASPSRE